MDITDLSREELEEKLENFIAENGVGSEYRNKIDRIQRDVNLALILGGSAAVLGLATWLLLRSKD